MSISRTAHVTLNEPSEEIDLEGWLFGLSDSDYQASARGHQGPPGRRRPDHPQRSHDNDKATSPVLAQRL